MSLRDSIANAVAAAVNAAADLGSEGVYSSFVTTSYDASAGVASTTYSSVGGVTFIFESFRLADVDGERVRSEDKKAHVAAKHLGSVTPTASDLIRVSSQSWNVVSVQSDPTNSLWTLQLRLS